MYKLSKMNSTYKHLKNINSHQYSLSKIFENIQNIHMVLPTRPLPPPKLEGKDDIMFWFYWFYYSAPCVEDQTQCLCACRGSSELHPPSLGKIFLLEWFCIVMESGQWWICLHLDCLKLIMWLKLRNDEETCAQWFSLSLSLPCKKSED